MRARVLLLSCLFLIVGLLPASAQRAPTPSEATEQMRRPIPYPISTNRGFDRAVQEGTRTRSGEPGPNYWTNTAEYTLDATIDPNTKMLEGTGTIRYHNNSPDTLRQLVVHLRQNIHKEGTFRNRPAEVTGGMTVERIDLGADSLQRLRSQQQFRRLGQGYVQQDTRLVVYPPEAIPPNGSATLNVDWHFRIPGADNFRMGQDGEVYFIAYWYPHMAVYDDVHGWRAQPYMGDGEFYMGYGDYDVSVTVPEGWLVGSTGQLRNASEVLPEPVRSRLDLARRSDTTVAVVAEDQRGAGSATVMAPDGDSTLTWTFMAENVRDVAFGTSAAFVWDATRAQTGEGTSMIHAFYRPEQQTWRRSAEFARFSIEHLSDMILPYPYPHMTTVEGPIGGGMEYPMITHIGQYGDPEGLFGVTYHEISHMWFPMLVGTDEKAYAWLDEGTTTFNETEGRDDFFPDQNAWAASEHFYFRLAPSVQTPSIRHADRYPVEGPARGLASYDKPAVMLYALRGILGEETFFEAYRQYAERWTYKHPTPYDLFNTFEEVSGRELDWFWRGAFYESWIMDHEVASVESTGDGVVVTVEDEGRLPMPVLLEAEYANGDTVTRRVGVKPWLNGKRSVEVTLRSGDVTSVTLDPNHTLPDLDRTNNDWTAQAAESDAP